MPSTDCQLTLPTLFTSLDNLHNNSFESSLLGKKGKEEHVIVAKQTFLLPSGLEVTNSSIYWDYSKLNYDDTEENEITWKNIFSGNKCRRWASTDGLVGNLKPVSSNHRCFSQNGMDGTEDISSDTKIQHFCPENGQLHRNEINDKKFQNCGDTLKGICYENCFTVKDEEKACENDTLKDEAVDNTSNERELHCQELEKKYVHDVYENTAHHFSNAKYKAWPRVRHFLEELTLGSLVLDVGCGHGKYLNINRGTYKIGSDHCSKLVDIAAEHGHQVMVCDNLRLPYRSNCFDAVISVGVIHHFTTIDRRLQAISELARVVKPGGKVMIYVWALEQNRRKFRAQDVLVPWHLKQKENKQKTRLSSNSSFSEDDESITKYKCKSLFKQSSHVEVSNQTSLTKGICGTVTDKDSYLVLQESPLQNEHTSSKHFYPKNVLRKERKISKQAMSGPNRSPFLVKRSGATAALTTAVADVNSSISSKNVVCQKESRKSSFIDLKCVSQYTTEQCSFTQSCAVPTRMCSPESLKINNSPDFQKSLADYDNVNRISDKTSDTSLGSIIKRKLASIFFSVKSKRKVSEEAGGSPMRAEASNDLCSFPCQPTPFSLFEGFAVREFPQSSQPAEISDLSPIESQDVFTNNISSNCFSNKNMNSINRNAQDAEDDYVIVGNVKSSQGSIDASFFQSEKPTDFSKTDLTYDIDSSSRFPLKYLKTKDTIMTNNYLSEVDKKSKIPMKLYPSNFKSNQSNSYDISQERKVVYDKELQTAESNLKCDLGDTSAVKGKSNIQNGCMIMTESKTLSTKSKLDKSSPKLSLRRKLFYTKTEAEQHRPVNFEIGGSSADLDSAWFTTTSNAIQKIESEVNKNCGDICSSIDKSLPNCDSMTPVKGTPRLVKRKFSNSSSLSSFSSDNFSDSEVEETLLTNGYGNNGKNDSSMGIHGKSSCYGSKEFHNRKYCSKNADDKLKDNPDHNNMEIDENSDTFKRYYHVFKENELDELIQKHIKSLVITSSCYDHANWCVVANKGH